MNARFTAQVYRVVLLVVLHNKSTAYIANKLVFETFLNLTYIVDSVCWELVGRLSRWRAKTELQFARSAITGIIVVIL